MKVFFVAFIWTLLIASGCSAPVIGEPSLDTPQSKVETPIGQISSATPHIKVETPAAQLPSATSQIKVSTPSPPLPSTTSQIVPEVSAPVPTFDPSLVSTLIPGATVITASDTNTLIAAILAANDNENFPDMDTIYLEGGLYSLYYPYAEDGEDGPSGLPSIRSKVTIIGNGATIERNSDSADEFRIFHVSEDGNLELSDLTIQNGSTAGIRGGGGVLNRGVITLQSCTFIDNRNTALYNFRGTMTLENCTIHRNQGILGGGVFLPHR